MAKLKDGNFYSQTVTFDYQNRKLLLNSEKTEFSFSELFLEASAQKVRRFPDVRQKLFVVFAIVMLVLFIYSDLVLLGENLIVNGFLVILWLVVLVGLLYYYIKPIYSLTLKHGDDVLVIYLNTIEKTEFEKQFSESH